MRRGNCFLISYQHVTNYLWGVFYLLILVLISSCGPRQKESAGYSEAFKPVFAKTSGYFASNKAEQGISYLDSCMRRIDKPYLDDRFRAYSFHYVYWKIYKGDAKKGLVYADSMLSIAEKSVTQKQYVSNYSEANMAEGDAYFAMQKFSMAYKHYFEGFRVGKNNLDNQALADYSYRMGMILYKMGYYKPAASYFKESLQKDGPTGDKFADFYRIQELLDNIALSYKHSGAPDSAIVYFDKALKYINDNAAQFNARSNMIEMARGVVYGNKAEVLIWMGRFDEAIDLLKKSIAINLQKGNDNNDAELTEIKLAQLYFDKNDNSNLMAVLNALKVQFDSVKNENAKADWDRLLSSYYLRKQDYHKSVEYLLAYDALKDSNAVQINRLRESGVNQQLENFEKQYQIDRLKNESKLQTVYLYVTTICAAMALFIVFLIFRNYKRSKRDVQTVNRLNTQVNQQKINLEKTLEELKSSSLEKDRILRAVAHDLRNPISGIASLTKLMDGGNYTEEQKAEINLIRETSNNSLDLINEILEATNNGATGLKKEWVEINSLLNSSVELMRFRASEKGQQINLELLDDPLELYISRERIWRVLGNLISNAIKFSPEGAVITVKITCAHHEIEITVADQGIGIPEDLKSKVFNTFTDAKRPGTAGEKSFGLGLSISRQIIEQHNGQIGFESDADGTTFYIKLPVGS